MKILLRKPPHLSIQIHINPAVFVGGTPGLPFPYVSGGVYGAHRPHPIPALCAIFSAVSGRGYPSGSGTQSPLGTEGSGGMCEPNDWVLPKGYDIKDIFRGLPEQGQKLQQVCQGVFTGDGTQLDLTQIERRTVASGGVGTLARTGRTREGCGWHHNALGTISVPHH